MRIFVGIVLLLLLFGCNGGEEKPPEDNGVTPPVNDSDDGKPPVTIIIGEQQNQTVEANVTDEDEDEEIEENISIVMEYEYNPDQPMGIYFVDVGDKLLHGDAILIKKGDLDILVDAGPKEKAGLVTDFLNSRGVDDIELLISTNADPRHYGGIEAVADKYTIEELWWSGQAFEDIKYENVIDKVRAEAKNTYEVADGHTAELNGIELEVLNPPVTDRFEDMNNDAIVTRLKDRNFSILLTSGIQTGAQGRLINQREDEIKNPLIQAPYYGVGAGTSNIGIFLIKAEPDAMIVSGSADESAVNGGSREPFERLMDQYGISWHENYVNGTLRVFYDGDSYQVTGLGG
jgi:competence protein ComEC